MAHNDNLKWTDSDIHDFIDDWKDDVLSMDMLSSKYRRSKKALLSQAFRLNLKPRVVYTRYLTVNDIHVEMSVSKSTVYRWISSGLKTRRCVSDQQKYLIHADDLLDYLEHNQSKFDASKVSKYLFINEPEWLLLKRKHDSIVVNTEFDVFLLKQYILDGMSVKDISECMHISRNVIYEYIHRFGYKPARKNGFTQNDILFLRQNSDCYTLSELSSMMNGRSENSIKCKCRSLKIPYHISKSKCLSQN